MSLLHPTAGEIIDRVSILEIKLQAYKKKGKDSTGLQHEKRELEDYFQKYIFDVTIEKDLKEYRDLLRIANVDIWNCIDETVALDLDPCNFQKLAILAKMAVNLNEKRMNVMGKLNGLYGEFVEEKIYL